MLEYLGIKNLAVIEDIEFDFSPGLNIITGETGAGKSMVVQALSLLRGKRASTSWIRKGEESAKIEAILNIEEGIKLDNVEFEDENNLNIERVIKENGKGRIKINGSLSSVSFLQNSAGNLIELSSQHDQQILLSPSSYLEIIDSFAQNTEQLKKMAKAFEDLKTANINLLNAIDKKNNLSSEKVNLKFIFDKIEKINPTPKEHESLLTKRERIKRAQDIFETAVGVENELYDKDGSIIETLQKSSELLHKFDEIEPKFTEAAGFISETVELLNEAVSILRYFSNIDSDEVSAEWIESRLHTLEKAFARFNCENEEELLELKEKTQKELDGLENFDFEIKRLTQIESEAKKNAVSIAKTINKARQKSANLLAKKITEELKYLGFDEAKFLIVLSKIKQSDTRPDYLNFENTCLTQNGFDKVDFLFDPNPGEDARPVSKGASGGELSRIHLAMKVALSNNDSVISTVYDEIDSGIGGPVAGNVGVKLKEVSSKKQVICITHLPQIAAFADSHYLVYKEVAGHRTFTRIKKLNEQERIDEIARMLGGISATTLEHAKALINQKQ